MSVHTKGIITAFCLAVSMLATSGAQAQFQDRAIRIIVPAGPGGTADILARFLAQELAATWQRTVLVENKPGAAGVIGTQALATAAPDGHTLALLPSNHAINPLVIKDLPYDTMRDVAAVARLAAGPGLLVVNPGMIDARDVQGALQIVKRQPGKFNFASPVPLTAGHRAMELLKHTASLDMQHIPYKSGADAVAAILGGQVQFLAIAIPPVLPHVENGKLRALAVTSRERFAGLPAVPTLSESGFPGFDSSEWYGLFSPAGIPVAVTQKISTDTQRLLSVPRVRERLQSLGLITNPGGPAELSKDVESENAKWAPLVKTIRLKAD